MPSLRPGRAFFDCAEAVHAVTRWKPIVRLGDVDITLLNNPRGQCCEAFLFEELQRFGPKAHPFR